MKRSLIPRRRQAGFTILEVALAASVMALAIATSVTALQAGFRMIDTARKITIAGQVLQSLTEDLRLLTWTQVTALPATTTGSLTAFDSDTVNHYQSTSVTGYSATAASMLSGFTFTRTVSAPATGQTELKVIVFTAKWTGIDGTSHTRTYTSYYAKNGLYDYFST